MRSYVWLGDLYLLWPPGILTWSLSWLSVYYVHGKPGKDLKNLCRVGKERLHFSDVTVTKSVTQSLKAVFAQQPGIQREPLAYESKALAKGRALENLVSAYKNPRLSYKLAVTESKNWQEAISSNCKTSISKLELPMLFF